MVKMSVKYQGEKHCELLHLPSNKRIETDAPRDNHGRGESFSPTDLMGAALASCVLTTMAINAEKECWSFLDASAEVEKHMQASPRRIAQLPLVVTMPAGLTPEQRQKLENIARHCPVALSLAPSVEIPMRFIYPD